MSPGEIEELLEHLNSGGNEKKDVQGEGGAAAINTTTREALLDAQVRSLRTYPRVSISQAAHDNRA